MAIDEPQPTVVEAQPTVDETAPNAPALPEVEAPVASATHHRRDGGAEEYFPHDTEGSDDEFYVAVVAPQAFEYFPTKPGEQFVPMLPQQYRTASHRLYAYDPSSKPHNGGASEYDGYGEYAPEECGVSPSPAHGPSDAPPRGLEGPDGFYDRYGGSYASAEHEHTDSGYGPDHGDGRRGYGHPSPAQYRPSQRTHAHHYMHQPYHQPYHQEPFPYDPYRHQGPQGPYPGPYDHPHGYHPSYQRYDGPHDGYGAPPPPCGCQDCVERDFHARYRHHGHHHQGPRSYRHDPRGYGEDDDFTPLPPAERPQPGEAPHPQRDAAAPPAPPVATMCCYFKQGSCKMGNDCWYSHDASPTTPCHYGIKCKAGHATLVRQKNTPPKPIGVTERAKKDMRAAAPRAAKAPRSSPPAEPSAAEAVAPELLPSQRPAAHHASTQRPMPPPSQAEVPAMEPSDMPCPYCGGYDCIATQAFPVYTADGRGTGYRAHCSQCKRTFAL